MSSQRVVDDGGTKQFMCLKLSRKIRVLPLIRAMLVKDDPLEVKYESFETYFATC